MITPIHKVLGSDGINLFQLTQAQCFALLCMIFIASSCFIECIIAKSWYSINWKCIPLEKDLSIFLLGSRGTVNLKLLYSPSRVLGLAGISQVQLFDLNYCWYLPSEQHCILCVTWATLLFSSVFNFFVFFLLGRWSMEISLAFRKSTIC